MNKILMTTVIAVTLMLTGCGNGPVTTASSNDLIDPDHYYELDTWGSNADVFEFTPRSNPNYTCVNVGGTSRSIDCFPKK